MAHEYIPNNLKALRKRAGLRQQDLAALIDLSTFDRVSKWENGLLYPSLEKFVKLLLVLQARPEDIYPELFGNLNRETSTLLNRALQCTE